jgi:uncharacterized MnhB-related membrane protein
VIWVAVLCVVVMVGAAVAVVVLRSLMAAIVASSVVSLTLAVLFVVLRAPDVAMTEAVVGAGLSGVLLAMAVRKTLSGPGGDDADA